MIVSPTPQQSEKAQTPRHRILKSARSEQIMNNLLYQRASTRSYAGFTNKKSDSIPPRRVLSRHRLPQIKRGNRTIAVLFTGAASAIYPCKMPMEDALSRRLRMKRIERPFSVHANSDRHRQAETQHEIMRFFSGFGEWGSKSPTFFILSKNSLYQI